MTLNSPAHERIGAAISNLLLAHHDLWAAIPLLPADDPDLPRVLNLTRDLDDLRDRLVDFYFLSFPCGISSHPPFCP